MKIHKELTFKKPTYNRRSLTNICEVSSISTQSSSCKWLFAILEATGMWACCGVLTMLKCTETGNGLLSMLCPHASLTTQHTAGRERGPTQTHHVTRAPPQGDLWSIDSPARQRE